MYLQSLQVAMLTNVFSSTCRTNLMKKYSMSSAFWDVLMGGGPRRSGEAGLVGAAEEPAVGMILAGGWGTACPSDASSLSPTSRLFKLNSSPEDGSRSACSPCTT